MTTAVDLGKEFVAYVVKALVDHPEEVRVEGAVDEMGVLITLYIHPEDMGKVIGRSGNTAKALRTLLRVVGAKHKARVNLKIFEPENSQRRFGGYNQNSQPITQDDQNTANSNHSPADDEFEI